MSHVFENVGRPVTCETLKDLQVQVETGVFKDMKKGTLIFGRCFNGLYALDIYDETRAEVWTCLFTAEQMKDNVRVLTAVEESTLFS